jgi:hypothetical protein
MKIPMKSRRPAIAYIALSVAAAVWGTCTADEETRGQTAASVRMSARAASASPAAGQQCPGEEFLVGPDGHKFRLAYLPGYGCKYVVDGNSVVLAVGPNGYAFEWSQESGWKLLRTAD